MEVKKKQKACPHCKGTFPIDKFIGRSGKVLTKCQKCSNSRYCQHGKQRYECYQCKGNLAIARVMVNAANYSDRQCNRPKGDLSVEAVLKLLDTITKCPQCDCDFQYINRHQSNGVTIQRIDNSKTHTIDNCTLWCQKCNQRDGNAWKYRTKP